MKILFVDQNKNFPGLGNGMELSDGGGTKRTCETVSAVEPSVHQSADNRAGEAGASDSPALLAPARTRPLTRRQKKLKRKHDAIMAGPNFFKHSHRKPTFAELQAEGKIYPFKK